MKARQQKANNTVGDISDKVHAIRAEDFKTLEINSFSESPFGQLISMLSFNIILKSTLLTDKLLRLLSFISIGLPDNPLSSTISTRASLSEIVGRIEMIQDHRGSSRTSSANTPNSATTENNITSAGRSKSELDERCLPESQETLRLAIEVLTSKSCSEEGLEDATTLLLNLSQCSTVTRSFILNLLIDGSKYLAEIVQKQINDLIVDLKQLNQRNRFDSGITTPAQVSQQTLEASGSDSNQPSPYSAVPSTSSGSKGILQDRFTKEKVIITSASKQKPRCELQLPSMVPLISKTASQSFFLRILKVVIQIRESANTVSVKFLPLFRFCLTRHFYQ